MFNLPQKFDGVVAIYDCYWYIKRSNNIEINKKIDYFGPLSHNFRLGGLCSPLHGASNGQRHTPASPVFNP